MGRAASVIAVAFMSVNVVGLCAPDYLPDEQRTNGGETLHAVDTLRQKVAGGMALIGPDKVRPLLMGVVVSADGYLLTKATEIQSVKKPPVWLTDGTRHEARVVRRDAKLDLALLKIDGTGLQTVTWGESRSLVPAQWLSALTEKGSQMRLGVLSAKRRRIPDSGAVMGVRFARGDKGDKGVQIEEVAEDGPAQQAGLKADDVIMSINEQPVNAPAAVRRIISAFHPGDVIRLKYKRGGKDGACEVKLASRSHVMMNWGGDFGNPGTSLRTDNFPEVIQHDMPLSPADMGGAVFDLQGRAVAINIARVDRVTNYALPAELFVTELEKWVKEDRDRKK